MKVTYDFDLQHFKAWSGAVSTLEELSYEEVDTLQGMIEEVFGNEATETDVNDFLWFETDTIAEWFGYKDWEEFLKRNDEEEGELKC